MITDKKEIPNSMNEYFCNTGNSLNENIPYEKDLLTEYNINFGTETVIFSEISEEEAMRKQYLQFRHQSCCSFYSQTFG